MRTKITHQQWHQLFNTMQPSMKLFCKLAKRLDKLGIVGLTGYSTNVRTAYDAMHKVYIETHYLACARAAQAGRATSTTALTKTP